MQKKLIGWFLIFFSMFIIIEFYSSPLVNLTFLDNVLGFLMFILFIIGHIFIGLN